MCTVMMKIPQAILLIALLSVTTTTEHLTFKRNPAPERAWNSFFHALRSAVKKRDRAALKEMMAPDFLYSFGGNRDRDEAFQDWDQKYVKGWSALEKVLAQGVSRPKRSPSISNGKLILSRVAPPAATKESYTNWRAVFEYGADGRWRMAAFIAGD